MDMQHGFPTDNPPLGADPSLVPLGDVLKHIQDARTRIVTMIKGVPKKSPAQTLGVAVEDSVDKVQQLVGAARDIEKYRKDCLDDFIVTLQGIQVDVEYRTDVALTSNIRRKAREFAGRQKHDDFAQCQAKLDRSFRAVEGVFNTMTIPSPGSTTVSQVGLSAISIPHGQTRATVGPSPATPTNNQGAPPPPKDHNRIHMFVDGTKNVLQIASGVAGVVPDPIGKIVKAIADTGLSIIKLLENVDDNKKEALRMSRHVAQLIKSIQQFHQDSDESVGDDTRGPLEAFKTQLGFVETCLDELKAQGKLKRGVAHERNKQDLADWTRQIDRIFKELQTHLALDALRLLTKLDNVDARRERDRLLECLGGADYGAGSKAADPDDLLCLPGTRRELLDEIDEWISNPSSENVLWINGVAGCGKTSVAATTARQQKDASATVATFHFDRGNQKRNESVICSLSRWLARASHDSLERFVLESVQDEPDIASLPLSTQFDRLLVKPLMQLAPNLTPTILVIDALDEWHDPRKASALINLIGKHASQLPSQVKFVITSRNEGHLASSFRSKSLSTVVKIIQLDRISSVDVDRDIESFFTTHFSVIRSESEDPAVNKVDWPGGECIKELTGMSRGLFQWAATVMQYIQADAGHEERLHDIRNQPAKLEGLDKLYAHILKRLFQEHTRTSTLALLQHVLGCIAVAQTPIALDVITYLYADKVVNFDKTKKRIRNEILAFLGSFLIIPDASDQPIKFLHPSFADFISKSGSDPRFYIEGSVHHGRLATIAFQRMNRDLKRNICNLKNPSTSNVKAQSRVNEFIPAGLQYSSCYWADHLSQVHSQSHGSLLDLLENFCQEHIMHWLEVLSLIDQTEIAYAVAKRAENWLSRLPTDSDTKALLQDTQRFVALFFEVISRHAGHIYISLIAQIPTETKLSQLYAESVEDRLHILFGPGDEYWPSSQWVSNYGEDFVDDLQFSSDGSVIAAMAGSTMQMWDVESGMPRGEIQLGPSELDCTFCCHFSPDGGTIASGSSNGTVQIWDNGSGKARSEPLVGHTGEVSRIVFSPDGSTIASASEDHTIRLWDVELGKARGELLVGHEEHINSLIFSPDGSTVFSASDDGAVWTWDAESGEAKSKPLNYAGVWDLSFSLGGKMIITTSDVVGFRAWDAQSGRVKRELSHCRLADITADGSKLIGISLDWETILLTSRSGTLQMWDLKSRGAKDGTMKGHMCSPEYVVFSPDGSKFASASLGDGTIRVWDAESGMIEDEPICHWDSVSCVVFSPSGKMIASASKDGSVLLLDAMSGVPKDDQQMSHPGYSSWTDVVFSPDGQMVVSASENGCVQLWDSESGVAIGRPLFGEARMMGSVVFSLGSEMLAFPTFGRTVRLWDLRAMKGRVIKADAQICCIALSPDAKVAVWGSKDGMVQTWDVVSGMTKWKQTVGNLQPAWVAVFSPDGKTIALAKSQAVWLCDSESGTSKERSLPISSTSRSIKTLRFSTDGGTLRGFDKFEDMVKEWDVRPALGIPLCQLSLSDKVQPETEITSGGEVSEDGWIRCAGRRWIWLQGAFLRDDNWKRYGNRVVVNHDRNVYILDVSDITYIVDDDSLEWDGDRLELDTSDSESD